MLKVGDGSGKCGFMVLMLASAGCGYFILDPECLNIQTLNHMNDSGPGLIVFIKAWLHIRQSFYLRCSTRYRWKNNFIMLAHNAKSSNL